MAATKLNPDAPPFPCPYALHHHPGTPLLQYHADACPPGSPVGAVYFYAQFPFPSPHHHPFVQFPILHPSQVLCKAGAAPVQQPARFLRKAVLPAKAARAFRNSVPPKALCAPAQPELGLPKDVGEPVPHGMPPHKLMATKKLQVAKDVATECRNAPATDAATDQMPAARRKAERRGSRNKNRYEGKAGAVVGPRTVRPLPRTCWSPSRTFTTPRRLPLPDKPPAFLGSCSTVMFRNIPNRLKCVELIALLDEHCARANRVAGAVVSAYDVVYLPVDFRRKGNFGYAFVNFTTGNAALELYYALQGCGWKVCGSHKHIDIVPAKIQGKEALVRHLSRHRFECTTEEYLPAVFSPPRDGGARTTATTLTRIGKLLRTRHVKKE